MLSVVSSSRPVINCPEAMNVCCQVSQSIQLLSLFPLSIFSKNSRFVRENLHLKDSERNLTAIFCFFLDYFFDKYSI